MGCVESRLESDLQTNIFHVVSVSERGQRQRSARLEVTETQLILHQRGRAPICWPLRCLRRYGFDAEQFSFESGRRSPSGPGIYNFKCRRAEALFNMLQFQIQNIADDTASRESTSVPFADTVARTDSRPSGTTAAAIDYQGYLEPFARTRNRATSGSVSGIPISSPPLPAPSGGANGGIGAFTTGTGGGGLRSPNSPAPLSPPAITLFNNQQQEGVERVTESPSTPGVDATPSTPLESRGSILMNYIDRTVNFINNAERPFSYSSSGAERPSVSYVNHVGRSQSERPLSFHKIESAKDLSTNFSQVEELVQCRSSQQPLYMNVDTTSDGRRESDHLYANLGLDKDLPIVPPRASGGSGSSHSGTTTTTETAPPQILYIHFDLDRGSDTSQTVPQSPVIPASAVAEAATAAAVTAPAVTAPSRTLPSAAGGAGAAVGTGGGGGGPPPSLGYATIDFDKTEALSTTARAAALWKGSDGFRRSRHNSTFSLGRHNSTQLSD